MSSLLPNSHEKFNEKEYWDSFFLKRKEEAFEWYGTFKDIQAHLSILNLPFTAKILMIGCGNSKLSVDLYDFGYENIVNIDFSELVIEEMRSKYSVSKPNMKWEVCICKYLVLLL